jgi:ankyrin repeat/SOCS box protein 2
MTPLSTAALSGKLDTLRFLLKHGANINGAAADGATPLYEACKNGHVSTVEVLLSLKADVNKSIKTGLLPIHVAVQKAHTRIVSLLIPVTSSRKITSSGISPLHIAAEENHNNIMELLLEAGFDPNCQLSEERRRMYEDKRSTALYFSIYNSNLEAAEMLLEAGANPNLDMYRADVNASISTLPSAFPSAVLLSMDHLPMLKLLLDHGCNARSCFNCVYGSKPHPTLTHSEEQRNWNSDAPRSRLQFCEAVSKPSITHLVGPLVSLLLNYVSHVRLCSRLMEHLDSSPLWTEIKIKAEPPHPLMQLCRLRIRHLVGVGRLKLLRDLDLPSRLIKFLCYEEDCCSLDLNKTFF